MIFLSNLEKPDIFLFRFREPSLFRFLYREKQRENIEIEFAAPGTELKFFLC